MTTPDPRVPDVSAAIRRLESGAPSELVFTFASGSVLAIDPMNLSDDIKAEALFHGLKQKIGDAGAISRTPETGRSATVADKRDAMRAVLDRLLAGQWNKVREGGSNLGLLLAAVCRLKPAQTTDALRTWLDAKMDAERAALRKNPKVAATILEIQAERLDPDVAAASDDMLDEI